MKPGLLINKYLLAVLLAILSLSLILPAGCAENQLDSAPEAGTAAETVAYEASEYGCRFVIPAGWIAAEEKKRQESLTLRLENSDQSGSLTVTVSAAGLHTADQLLAAAEEALRSGLYRLDEPVVYGNMTLESGECIPLLEATAGSNEKFEAQTAVLSGAGFNARVTLIAREDHCAGCRSDFAGLLESFETVKP